MEIASLHFLVAEGEPVQRELLAGMLRHLGARHVTQASDGLSALRLLEIGLNPPANIALMDLTLPGMDGLEVLRRLAEIDCRAGIIIFASQSADVLFSVETMAEAYGLDVLGSSAKPITSDRLQELLANYRQPSAEPEAGAQHPEFSFAEVGRGLQGREFDPYFQPKIELETCAVKGLEVFARWRHPEHGVLGPSAFMPVLESVRRIDFLDWCMIEKSVAACRGLHDKGIPISISVNVDPGTLAHPQFIAQMTACLERHRIRSDYVTFEITEASVLTTNPHFIERLLRLRMMGFGLAIDDYGTGRSNLQLLAAIPFSELKIDPGFVDGAARKRPIGTVLKTCLGLARSLSRHGCAVGVESRDDWDFLQGLGCTYAQGFYIANPMPVDDIPGWLDDWKDFF
ncbi:EAL domain-containing protein [Pseudoduganella sp. S-14]|uniref:EAL domain-containing response regulator n=1 Tax=Pseudoduganella sp. S-14 TaxID=3404065 RepID=UPI003CF75870